ncbi:16S rRNA (adenine(1518)-N(6)/adenine(1519)-N(6))-dimethyltransferase RsmA [Microtetraspora glauca]|uniref:Ribosomal RNA small subunit methyltransferase A n=1 Tax=Microtetraspora glauca TaxID=1996 RepID=A0ABV3GB93_MICGL
MSLLGPVEVRALAEKLGIRPTKKLGQNFVIDGGTVRRIVRVAEVTRDDVVIEIGPGLGSLTLALLPEVARVVAVEIDPVLAAQLPVTVTEMDPEHADRLSVVHADALKVTPDDLRADRGDHAEDADRRGADADDLPALPDLPTALVANLPYNVSVPVLLHLLEILPSLRRGLVMVQSEVADRLAAPPGSRIYGVPSVKAAWYADVRRAGPVGRNVFWPAPNVDSGLVSLVRRDPPETSATREEVFAVVDAAFAQRRKTLRAALASWAGTPAAAEQALVQAGVQPSARGEQLGVADFARIAENRPRHR